MASHFRSTERQGSEDVEQLEQAEPLAQDEQPEQQPELVASEEAPQAE